MTAAVLTSGEGVFGAAARRVAEMLPYAGRIYGLEIALEEALPLSQRIAVRLGEIGARRYVQNPLKKSLQGLLRDAVRGECEIEWTRRFKDALRAHWAKADPYEPWIDTLAKDWVGWMERRFADVEGGNVRFWDSPDWAARCTATTTPVKRATLEDGYIEIWCLDGEYHRDSTLGPAYVAKKTGQFAQTIYFEKGMPHRLPAAGPAVVEEYFGVKPGRVEEYYYLGKLHRPASDGPAVVDSYCGGDGGLVEVYFEHGVKHRPHTAGPAYTSRYADGVLKEVQFCKDGELHRPPQEGPALRYFCRERHSVQEEYRWEGRLHRPWQDGPAMRSAFREDDGQRHGWVYYMEHGVNHRPWQEGPAVWGSFDNGAMKVHVAYLENGEPVTSEEACALPGWGQICAEIAFAGWPPELSDEFFGSGGHG